MIKSINMKHLEEVTDYTFRNGFTCGETIVYVLNNEYELNLSDSSIALSSGFPFGFGNGGNLCGAVAGATMILGAVFGRTKIEEALPEKCLNLVRELNEYIIGRHSSCLCPDIIKDYDFTSPERKDCCSQLLFDVLHAFARIMERECGVTIS